ncbi:MAG: hypothetical protein ACLGQW_12520 [Acidobacteriota bacterium]|uniref:hypothetical protein n=1 Tax=Fundidesulfovibrio agrisoli TaxID=2922717 RepID=UPI001FAC7E12|nr:hypothetical protein [Fundidesulfovibrio agrisoli]
MKRLMLGLCLLLLSGCAVYKDKDGVTHYELLPPAPAVYYGPDPYYAPPAYYYGPYPYYYQGYYYGPGHYRWYWR